MTRESCLHMEDLPAHGNSLNRRCLSFSLRSFPSSQDLSAQNSSLSSDPSTSLCISRQNTSYSDVKGRLLKGETRLSFELFDRPPSDRNIEAEFRFSPLRHAKKLRTSLNGTPRRTPKASMRLHARVIRRSKTHPRGGGTNYEDVCSFATI